MPAHRTLRTAAAHRRGPAPFLGLLLLSASILLSSCATHLPASSADLPVTAPSASAPLMPQGRVPDLSGAGDGFSRAVDAFTKGDYETSARLAQAVMDRFPGTAWSKRSLFLLGRTFIARGMTVDADRTMLRVPAEYPDLADYALFLLAGYDRSIDRPGSAAVLYQRLLNDYEGSLLASRASLARAQALSDQGSYADAAAAFERTMNDFPDSDEAPLAGLGLGRVLAAAGDLAGAAKAVLQVGIRYPAADREGEGEGERLLAEIRARGGTVPPLTFDEQYERAGNQFRAMQYGRAVESFQALLEADSSYSQKADILLRTGIALYKLGRRAEAALVLDRLLKAKLPDCRHAEALYWLGKSYSRLGQREEAVATYLRIVRSFPESERADDALYLAGNVYRDANDTAKANAFYRRLAEEYPDSPLADSAIWWQGWASYAAADYAGAVRTLRKLVGRYPRSFLANQALYWEGRAEEQRGNRERAGSCYGRILRRGPYTYYGYRAAERLAGAKLPVTAADGRPVLAQSGAADSDVTPDEDGQEYDEDEPPVWTDDAVAALSAYPAYRKALELMYLGMRDEAAEELWYLRDLTPRRYGALLGLSKAFFELGDYHSSLLVILRGFDHRLERPSPQLPEDLWLLAYPQGYWQSILSAARQNGLDPYFVAAIIREESQFRAEAVSPAGARGVMQVMPSTGEWIARKNNIAGFDCSQLLDHDVNIAVGVGYLAHLMKRFDGVPYLVSAAYNAGPEAVASWLEKSGGKREADVFVETIPYAETRWYVKKVLRNYAEYRRIYGGADAFAGLSAGPGNSGAKSPVASGARLCRSAEQCP